MAVKCSSSSAMKASLVLMLLFGAHAAVEVEIYNDTCMDIKLHGITIGAGLKLTVIVDVSSIVLSVKDAEGKVVSANYSVPANGCKKFRVVCKGGKVYVEATCKKTYPRIPEPVGVLGVGEPGVGEPIVGEPIVGVPVLGEPLVGELGVSRLNCTCGCY